MDRRTMALALLIAAASACGATRSQVASRPHDARQELYEDRCGRCHDAVPRHAYTSKEWPAVVQRMRMEARLSEDETRMIVAWLQEGR